MSLDDEWQMFLHNSSSSNNTTQQFSKKKEKQTNKQLNEYDKETTHIETDTNMKSLGNYLPDFDDLYISTKTKVLFLNMPINIHSIFWLIPIIEYGNPTTGVIKKQIKVVSKSPEEFEEYKLKLKDIPYYRETIIKQIEQSSSNRFKFKDERKITVGLSKKDIMNCRGKAKNAFYNCFALIFRVKYEGMFREIHVKIFNTGKLEIPGVVNINILNIIKVMIIDCIQPFVDEKLLFTENELVDNVLINSNFNCNYFINREKLYNILCSNKYEIESAYDPCSYPGIKCKFYYNNSIRSDISLQKGKIEKSEENMKMSELKYNNKYTEISFMIFRTGSCLIVGNCSESILYFVYDFIKRILTEEYENIFVLNEEMKLKHKKIKLRKKNVHMTEEYYNQNCIVSETIIETHHDDNLEIISDETIVSEECFV
jgi:hypothetical protein